MWWSSLKYCLVTMYQTVKVISKQLFMSLAILKERVRLWRFNKKDILKEWVRQYNLRDTCCTGSSIHQMVSRSKQGSFPSFSPIHYRRAGKSLSRFDLFFLSYSFFNYYDLTSGKISRLNSLKLRIHQKLFPVQLKNLKVKRHGTYCQLLL